MNKFFLVFSWLLFSSLNVLGQAKITREEYAVYGVALKSIYKENRRTYSNASQFVILKTTAADPELELPSEARYKNLVTDFKRKNIKPEILEKKLPPGDYSKTYYLITQEEIDEFFKLGRIEEDKVREKYKSDPGFVDLGTTVWIPFYQKYSDSVGYYSLSRVGFSRTFAMVHVKEETNLFGFSRWYILKKTKRGWQILTFGGIESVS